MSAFSFSFGSFGDFVAAVQLLVSLVNALNDSNGSSRQYRDLMAELSLLDTTLAAVQGVLANPGSRISNAQSLETGVALARHAISAFLSKHEKFGSSLGVRPSAGAVQRVTHKVLWLFKRGEVAELRESLRGLALSFQIAIGYANHAASRDILVELNRLRACVDAIYNRPRTLGYTWEGDSSPQVRIHDALGVELELPAELTRDWKHLRNLLTVASQFTPASPFLSQGQFLLRRTTDGALFGKNTWKSEDMADYEVAVLVTIRTNERGLWCPACNLSLPDDWAANDKCPRCGARIQTIVRSYSRTDGADMAQRWMSVGRDAPDSDPRRQLLRNFVVLRIECRATMGDGSIARRSREHPTDPHTPRAMLRESLPPHQLSRRPGAHAKPQLS